MMNKKNVDHWHKLLEPKKHIRTSDIGKGNYNLTIKDFGFETVTDPQDFSDKQTGVLYFEETDKYLIPNATCLKEIEMTGWA
jgi:hypothetical protein